MPPAGGHSLHHPHTHLTQIQVLTLQRQVQSPAPKKFILLGYCI